MESQAYESEIQKDTFEFLMKKYYRQIMKLVYSYVRDLYEAEDITQEIFYKVYRHLKDFKGNSSYYTWIYKIAVNQCRDYLKSATYRKRALLQPFSGKIIDLTVQRQFEAIESKDLLKKIFDLPVKLKEVIILYYFESFTTVEIAEILSISENTVRTRLSRGRKKLEKLLSKEVSL